MKRRAVLRYTGLSLTTLAAISSQQVQAAQNQSLNSNSVLVEWFGQTCFLFTANGQKVLVNPFRTIGCTAGYRLPSVNADIVLISSALWDEGAAEDLPGKPKVFYEAGDYNLNGLKIQGIAVAHDREKGRRFGTNIAWSWQQGGIKILHLGGAAAPIAIEQKILMGTPDLALIPVGGGPKAYNPIEAQQALEILKPKVMIPTQYLTQAADQKNCDLVGIEEFLELVKDFNIRKINNNQIRFAKKDLPPQGTLIRVLNSESLLKIAERPSKKP